MSERLRSALSIILKLVLYVIFIVIAIIGQRTTSWSSLGLECIGLVGVVCMLWTYNRSHK